MTKKPHQEVAIASIVLAAIMVVTAGLIYYIQYREPVIEMPEVARKSTIYSSSNLGINLPWLDLHNGTEKYNWLNEKYDPILIERDLEEIRQMGITKIRTFCQVESVFDYKNGKFEMNEKYIKNLDDFLSRAANRDISVICVLGAGNYEGEPKNLDGVFRWDLITSEEGLKVYTDAYIAYINHLKRHSNILMWEIHNEPYASLTWSPVAQTKGITEEHVRDYLYASYAAIKPLVGDVYVGISELEEDQQEKYRFFADPVKRAYFIDDITDVYSLHIYRKTASEVADFTDLTGKPKWVVELGSYNYVDPEGVSHPVPANNELYNTEENYISTVEISNRLVEMGFDLIMPWGFSSNGGMVIHNSDGSHTLLKLPLWIKDQLTVSR